MKAINKILLILALTPILASAQDFSNVQITATEVRDGIYMLQGQGGNIGVSIGADGTMIVDNQFAPLTEKIQAAIDDLGGSDVTFVVNTHFHYDHSDGNENFGRAGAYIVAQENARRRMESTQVLANGYVQEPYDPAGMPKITFFDSVRFYFNDQTVDVINTGNGHTDGDSQTYWREANVIHTGDMFVRYTPPFIDQNNGGSMDGMIEAAAELASIIDNDTIIIPGHGPLSNRQDLLNYRDMLVTIRGRLTRAKLEGMTPEEMLETEPTDGYAEMNINTAQWLLRAYDEYR